MLVHVAVADRLSPYAEGMASMLRAAGVSAHVPQDLEAWAGYEQEKVIFLTLASESDWQRLEGLRMLDQRLLIVAVMEVVDQTACVRALTAGAVSILPRDAPPQAVQQVLDALASDQAVTPLGVVQALAGQVPNCHDGDRESAVTLAPEELDWLRRLAEGVTVRQLADDAGYSERMMFRMLRNVYRRLRVDTRTQALFLARQRGWI